MQRLFSGRAPRLVTLLALLVLGLSAILGSASPSVAGSGSPVGHVTGRVSAGVASRSARFIFTLRNLPVGSHTLGIFQAGTSRAAYVPVRVRKNSTARLTRVTLATGGQIAGIVTRVTDLSTGAGEPLAGVEVVAERVADDGGKGPVKGAARLVVVTDEGGAYAFRGAPPGSYQVSVAVPGLEGGLNWVYVEANRTAVADFQLREAIEEGVGKVRGRITTAEGDPIEGALVSVYTGDVWIAKAANGARIINPGIFSTLTDENGDYSLNVPSGYGTVFAFAEGYLPSEQSVVVRKRQTVVVDLSLQVDTTEPYGTVFVQVVDANWMPVAGAVVSMTPPYVHPFGRSSMPVISGETDENGMVYFDAVAAGEWIVTMESGKSEPQRQVIEVVPGVATDVLFTVGTPRK